MVIARLMWAVSSALEPWLALTAWALCAWGFWRWWNRSRVSPLDRESRRGETRDEPPDEGGC